MPAEYNDNIFTIEILDQFINLSREVMNEII